jgi:hypothetical protein
MNKKGLLGTILIVAVVVIALISLLTFWQIKSKGIQITSGNFIIDINYDEQPEPELSPENNVTNNKTTLLENATSMILNKTSEINFSDINSSK